MTKLLVCIDGSIYTDNICTQAAWVSKILNAEIDLLHVEGEKSRNKGNSERQTPEEILARGEKNLKDAGVKKINLIQRKGSFLKNVIELEKDADMVFMGKRGEDANVKSAFVGANLEKTARALANPLFVVSSIIKPVSRFLISYDGSEIIDRAIDHLTDSPLLKMAECHLLAIESSKRKIDLSAVEKKFKNAGFKVVTHTEENEHPDEAIAFYVVDYDIDLLVTGAYSHSKLHGFVFGSTTASLIKACKIPLLFFR